jgi:DNA polymerase V
MARVKPNNRGSISIHAGFPNPVEDTTKVSLDVHDYIVKHPASTFYMRVEGNSWADMGIRTGDLLVVDKSLEMQSGDLIVAYLEGDFTLRYFIRRGNRCQLVTRTGQNPIFIDEQTDFVVWGVVTFTIHSQRGSANA